MAFFSWVIQQPPKVNQGEEFVNYVISNSIPRAITLEDVKTAYESDPSLQHVIKCINENNWKSLNNEETILYHRLRSELTFANGVLLRNWKLVIPHALRNQSLSLAHEGYLGIVKSKARLRSKVWWPGIDKDIEKFISSCHSCQLTSCPDKSPPLIMTPLPEKPWSILGIDLCAPFPSGESLLVVVDYYSRFPFAEIIRSTTSSVIISRLFKLFSVHGLPDTINTDNGRQFVSEQFEEFLKINGITHRKVTPYWPQANGQVERINKFLKKNIQCYECYLS